MIEHLLEDLKADEGWRPWLYFDTRGFATIGYGFLIDERLGGEMPLEIGEAWLRIAAEERWFALLKRLPWLETQPEDVQRALANLAYQVGVDGVLGFKLMLGHLQNGRRESAAECALDSHWREQTPERAKRVAALLRGHA